MRYILFPLFLLLVSGCGAYETLYAEECFEYTINYESKDKMIVCKEITVYGCGAYVFDCSDGNIYRCMHNLKVEEVSCDGKEG